MKRRKKLIFYCDDQPRFIEQFSKRHGSEFEIETTTKAEEAAARIEGLKRKPDLILLDLFHPRRGADEERKDEFERNRLKAEEKLQELTRKIEEVKPYIERAWSPVGIDLLDEIRHKPRLKNVPILFYSQRGLLFMSDQQLQQIYGNDCDFMLKEAENATIISERERMHQVIRQHPGRFYQIGRWTIERGSALAGFVVSALVSIVIAAILTKLGIL